MNARATTALGIDVGSTNTKAVLVAIDGDQPAERAVRRAPTPRDAMELLDVVLRLVAETLRAAGPAMAPPVVIGIASMAETGAALDAEGTPVTELIAWNVAHTHLDVDTMLTGLGRDALFSATGVPPGLKAPLAVWAWLRMTRPRAWDTMARWASIADIVCLGLTGEFATDHTLAGRTMAYRLPALGEPLERAYDADLLAEVGMSPRQLPAVRMPGEVAGRVTDGAAERTGLRAGTPLIVAGHDHAVGSWAAGTRRPGDVADSVGTAEALVRILSGPADRLRVAGTGVSLTRTVTGERESLLSGSANAGSFVRWWFEAWFDGRAVEDVLEEIGSFSWAPTGLVVLPYVCGRQTPAPDPGARVRVLGGEGALRARKSGDVAQAAFEALSMQLRWMDAEQRRLVEGETATTHAEPPMRVLGGPGADPRRLHVSSAVLARPLDVVTAAEPVAAGAALLAAVRLDPALARLTLPARRVEPPAPTPDYDAMYAEFVRAATTGTTD